MARSWPLRLRFLHADFCAGERVMVSASQRGQQAPLYYSFQMLSSYHVPRTNRFG
ncbi:Putative protein without homology [Lacticaseibacillus rhamnosus GG]|nr:Putative protein without homology [Lacticaseibacillus rhamnosus GG]